MILFIHDNARLYTTKLIEPLLKDFRWDVFGYPAHSPDLASPDFYLFPNLQRFSGSKQLSTNEEVVPVVHDYLSNLDVSFCATYQNCSIASVLVYPSFLIFLALWNQRRRKPQSNGGWERILRICRRELA